MMDFNYENKLRKKRGYSAIVGLDEVGRGPLAGPVTVCVFYFSHNIVTPRVTMLGLRDSKLLSPKKREELYKIFCDMKKEGIVDFATASCFPPTVDKRQIHHSVVIAMRRAVKKLNINPDFAIIDGFSYRQDIFKDLEYEKIRKADNLVPCVAAASIVAKVKRDKSMQGYYHKKYPQYRFDLHKGYGTRLHYKMLRKHGPSPAHRKSFRLS